MMRLNLFLSTMILLFLVFPLANAELPPLVVYKTRSNYNDLVPIGLSHDNSKVVVYSDQNDVYYMGELAYPTKLKNGYLLDNKGIGPDSAFLNTTYEDYSQLEELPPEEIFLDMVIDPDPFLEMYNCGVRNIRQDEVKKLNDIISQNKLSEECTPLLDKPPLILGKQRSDLIYILIGIAAVVTIAVIILYPLLRKKKKRRSISRHK